MQNAEATRFLSLRADAAEKNQKKTTLIPGFIGSQKLMTGQEWNEFIVCTLRFPLSGLPLLKPTAQKMKEKPTKAKKMENKATRWPENRLLDAIAQCFSEHRYWSIRAFRGRIPQPEAYLRETLDKIAVLQRSGTFANHWSLKPEYQGMVASLPKPADDAAVPKADALSDEEDDEDIKMEDVL